MAISQRRHREGILNQSEIEIIQRKLLTAFDANAAVETPQFLNSKYAQGVFWITCANESTKDWLIRTVSGLGKIWECAELSG
jgi:hypothetical protein